MIMSVQPRGAPGLNLYYFPNVNFPCCFQLPPHLPPCTFHLCSACAHCKKIISPLQTVAVPHLLPNSLWLFGYHLQWKGHRKDKCVQRYMACWTLSVPRHRITCQFGLKWEPSNTVLITLAEQTNKKKNLHSVHFLLRFWLLGTQNVSQIILKKWLWVCYPDTVQAACSFSSTYFKQHAVFVSAGNKLQHELSMNSSKLHKIDYESLPTPNS